ncbi:MAG: AAA family ATPase [Bryobacteraceae bacterium]|jgi:pilus assembly protein CpaE
MNGLVAGVVIANPDLRQEVICCLREMLVRVPIDETQFGDLGTLMERVDLVRPDVLIVEIGGLGDRTEEALRAIKSHASNPAVIVVDSVAQPALIIASMRGGAMEYLYPPFDGRLRAALQRIWVNRGVEGPAAHAGKTLGFLSVKGGCGATTIACHLAREFQRQTEQRTLLADLDLEAGMIQFLLKTDSPYSVLDAVANVHRLDSCFWKALVSNGVPRLEVITAPARGAAGPVEEVPFRHVLRFTRSQYDWILADLGRGLNPVALSLLGEIDECFLVTTLDVPALYKAKHLMQTLVEGGYRRDHLRLIVNRVEKHADLTLDDLERMVGLPAYGLVASDYPALHEAHTEGRLAEPGGILGMHYARLAAKITGAELVVPKPKRRFISLF